MKNWVYANDLACQINCVIDSYTEMNTDIMGKEGADEKAETVYKWAIDKMKTGELDYGRDYVKAKNLQTMFSEKFAENLLKEVTEKIAF